MKERTTKFALRLPTDLYLKVKAMADSEERSINSQILYILRKAVEKDGRHSTLDLRVQDS